MSDTLDPLGLDPWDVALRYHELKSQKKAPEWLRALRTISAKAVLEQAQLLMGSVSHPSQYIYAPYRDLPAGAIDQGELDIETTIEEGELYSEFKVNRIFPMTLSIDTSLSMTGEKLALTAVALAVVLLQFPDDPIGMIAFENEAMILKRPEEKLTVHQLVERFLDVPAQGYTHLEDGLKAAFRMNQALQRTPLGRQGRPPVTVLLTDGKYTAGRDPGYLGSKFRRLIVVKMGSERASLPLCKELVQKGRGELREVHDLSHLPQVMYSVVRGILRS